MNSENGVLVAFYKDAVQNNFKTSEAGRPIFDEKVFVHLQTPGDTQTEIRRIATQQDEKKFPKAWAAFQSGEEVVLEGTPLEQWPGVTTSQVKELAYVNVRTVEQLVGVSDANIQKLGPGYAKLKQNAKIWIDRATADANASKIARENQQLKDRIKALEDQLSKGGK